MDCDRETLYLSLANTHIVYIPASTVQCLGIGSVPLVFIVCHMVINSDNNSMVREGLATQKMTRGSPSEMSTLARAVQTAR